MGWILGLNAFLSLMLVFSEVSSVQGGGGTCGVKLKHMSTLYLPHAFSGDNPQYQFDNKAAEKSAVDVKGKIIYVIGENILHIVNASNPMNLTYLNHVTLTNKELTDVEVCESAVFVTYVDKQNLLQGGVLQYDVFSEALGTVTLKRDMKTGPYPDSVAATKNCTLVIALTNPGVVVNGRFQNPPGAVGVIKFPDGVAFEPHIMTADFTNFNHMFNGLEAAGVRWSYRGTGTQFSDEVEPEHVTLNSAQTKAYITLLNNNAMAEFDLRTANVTGVYGLGFKKWQLFSLDPSDRDGGIHMQDWPVWGMYQPSGLQWFRWAGADYILTANEGDIKSYPSVNFREDRRGRNFPASDFAASVSDDMKAALRNNSKLGRLKLSKFDGKNQVGKFEKFYTFGGRSFSIRRASDMALVYDSGSSISDRTRGLRRDLFNNDIGGRNSKVADGMDKRSCIKGPEPVSVDVAQLKGCLLLFVGIERPGTIGVYSTSGTKDWLPPRFQTLYSGIPLSNRTWGRLYDDRRLHAVDPEDIRFIGTEHKLADYPMLMVSSSVSGTVSLLKVELTDPPTSHGIIVSASVLATITSLVAVTWISLP